MMVVKEEPWVPCTKPCRFLNERLYESPNAGVLAGVEQRCCNPVYGYIEQLKVLLSSAQTIVTVEKGVLDGTSHENSYKLSRERIHGLANIVTRMWEICGNISVERPNPSRDHFFTREPEEEDNEG
jgi:hypothetical protein